MIGSELAHAPETGFLEKTYIKLFGVPINGLRIRLRRILPLINGQYKSILDAGCGRGVFSFELAKKFPDARVIGIDMDEKQININQYIAKKAKLDNLQFIKMDISELSFRDEFDLIISVDNLEHIDDDVKAISLLHIALRDKGKLVVHVPAYERRWLVFSFQTNFSVPGHVRPGYTIEELESKIINAGFSIVNTEYTYGFLENLSNNISYCITKAESKNKVVYAALFPMLNAISYLGRWGNIKKGAGILCSSVK